MRYFLQVIIILIFYGCNTPVKNNTPVKTVETTVEIIKNIDTFPDGKKQVVYDYPDEKDSLNYLVKQYNENGKLLFEAKAYNKKFIDSKINYYENGNIQSVEKLYKPVSFNDSTYDCDIKEYRENGSLQRSYSSINNLTSGKEISYDSSGRIDTTIECLNGQLNGKEIIYYPSGKIKSIIVFKNNIAVGFKYDFKENGDTLRAFANGGYNENGVFYKKWLPSGLILTETMGNKERTFVIWKWMNKGKEVKRLISKGKLMNDGRLEFIAPE